MADVQKASDSYNPTYYYHPIAAILYTKRTGTVANAIPADSGYLRKK
jgi:hypothetical protein